MTLTTLATRTQLATYLSDAGLPVSDEATDEQLADLATKLAPAVSATKYAAWVINLLEGNLTSDDLNTLIQERFPSSKKTADRRGGFYASWSRNGKLAGCNYSIGKSTRQAKPNEVASLNARIAELEAKLEAVSDCKTIKQVRAAMNLTDES
jgi:hypothetical protein